ncbi:MAG: class I SAM-dependent methyltransferase [Theionarchaea archaeon]|nr:class I SAM-dependent methyltransferase [Theionarchaea archaeon]
METLSGTIEDYPDYYDIIFGTPRFEPGQFNVKTECEFLDEIFEHYNIKSVIELACGPAYHAVQLAKMGYETAGLDISVPMLKFAEKRAQKEGVTLRLYHQDMRIFRLTEQYNAAICVLDSLRSLTEAKEILSHLKSVASVLTEKGIFVTEWSHPRDWIGERTVEDSWTAGKGSITVEASVQSTMTDVEQQLTTDILEFIIIDGENQYKITQEDEKRLILPQEFLLFASMSEFEFISFYGAYDTLIDLNNPNAWRTIAVLQKV